MKSIRSRAILLVAFTVIALALFLPSTPISKSLPSFWANGISKVVLGLDLQGGMHLVLDVDREKAVETYVHRMADSLETVMKEKGVAYVSIASRGQDKIAIIYESSDVPAEVKEIVGEEFPVLVSPKDSGGELVFTLDEQEYERILVWASSQAIETIRNRIDKFGVTEPLIQKQGDTEIVIQLPGLKDPERAIALIGKTAVLEFRMIDEENDPKEAVDYGPPFGSELVFQDRVDTKTGRIKKIPYLVKREVLLTGDLLSDARVAFDSQFNEPYVSLTFDSTGARIFERITGENVNKRIAIILDGKLHSAPVVRERIAGGRAQVSGGFTLTEATDLAIVLRAGALPAPVDVIQNVTVGPTLGKDSIEAGIRAIILGAVLVLGFMLIYYRLSGLIANIAITLNIVMLLGAMSWLGATLTLPGIAGILLTIGMGVDSNVLIFERIKEELKAGRTSRSAINAGYDKAWWTIVDSHVTTLITAAVLFQFGSGPIKGFAVTLSLGILINLFTSLVGTKFAFDLQNEKFNIKKLSI
jgi:preprotein translocase subunit SecD